MEELIHLNSFPVQPVLEILLKDKTTQKNIIWATSSYEEFGINYADEKQMTVMALTGLNSIMLQPRIMKAIEQQQERTKSKAEVFTPSWICNRMNNYCDEEWFGRKDVFNIEDGQEWKTVLDRIEFPEGKTWKQYIDSRRLEITCGEAPYLVSRYDASTGEMIDIKERIGVLDRKLRIVNENTDNEEEWFKWTVRAFQSVYGYEYQGDNLLIGRINLLVTFVDYFSYRWNRKPSILELRKIANIISWNLWQMDGLTGTVPLGEPEEEIHQYTIFDLMGGIVEEVQKKKTPKCKIYDWRARSSVVYESIRKGR